MKRRIVLITVFTMLMLSACGSISGGSESNDGAGLAGGDGGPRIIAHGDNLITVPYEINSIAILGPSKAEILVGLGFGDRIIATDRFAYDVVGLDESVVKEFGIMDPDAEYIVNLMPDIIFISGPSVDNDGAFAPLINAGITIIAMPTSTTVAGIMADIRFIASVMGDYEAGESIIATMQSEIDEITQIAATISETRTVYFEVAPLFSLGSGTFLNELIELAGAENVFSAQEGWVAVVDEAVLEANPDVIITSTNFIDDPIGEIMERAGFDTIAAVQNEQVFQIDTSLSNRPTHNITRALRYIAEFVYPEYFR